jgi:Zn-dependent peptidase ImmA (M78 family)
MRTADDRPHHVANIILRRMGVTRPPVSVESIAIKLGVKIERKSNPGFIGAVDSTCDPPVIILDQDGALVRQRFTIAHELGHLFMHPLGLLLRESTFARSGQRSEEEANEFAASLLMPLWLLEPIVTGSRRSEKDIANLFVVSQGALALQLQKLAP